MKKLLLALLMVAGITAAQAQVAGNFGLTSDYRFRGISQTQNGLAVQGGVDYTHSSGFYAGNTTLLVGGIEYDPYVMSPTECAVILASEPTSLVLTTPNGSVNYPT